MRRTSTYASRTESDCGLCYNQQRNRRAEISAKNENGDDWCRQLNNRSPQLTTTMPENGCAPTVVDASEGGLLTHHKLEKIAQNLGILHWFYAAGSLEAVWKQLL